jgi:hypothetical protein
MQVMNPNQIKAVPQLPGPKCYAHFIKVVADRQSAWGLYADGWALASTDEGDPVFPLWPAQEYAELTATNDWASYCPREIDIEDIFDGLLPSLLERGTLLGIFPTPTDKSVLPDITTFENDLRRELAKFF